MCIQQLAGQCVYCASPVALPRLVSSLVQYTMYQAMLLAQISCVDLADLYVI